MAVTALCPLTFNLIGDWSRLLPRRWHAGKQRSCNLLSLYYSSVRKDKWEEEHVGQREDKKKKNSICKKRDQSEGRPCERKTTGIKNEKNFPVFVLSGMAGVSSVQPCSDLLAGRRWLCCSPLDKSAMKPDRSNTDHQRKPLAR